jgi:hypothetical protein
MKTSLHKTVLAASLIIAPLTSYALPIDWHGTFGVDSTIYNSFRKIKSKSAQTATNNGSQEVALDAGAKDSASWQSYVFKLNPTMVINDAATLKGEFTTGYANGGYLGDSPQVDKASNNSIPVYYHNKASGSGLNVRQAYLELYSDTATYLIGRHTTHWGLGAIYNDGTKAWDRHSSSRDGITMKVKIGNFHVSPFWSKFANPGLTDTTSAKEMGVGLLYDNDEQDIAFGIMYGVRSSNSSNTFYTTTINTTTSQSVGETEVKITDIFLKKEFGKFDLSLEVPLMSGDLGRTNGGTSVTSYSAKAILLQTNYKLNDTWTFGFDGGKIDGHDGSSSKFGALYLNPNYQVANILYRYNVSAVGDRNQSVYDSYVTNTMFFKLRSSYVSEKWIFDTAVVYAKAEETATAGRAAYNHTKNKIFTAATTQSDDLGTEIDLNARYKWNNEITIGAGVGYLITGDYYSYTNDANVRNEADNSLLLQINTSVTF